MLTREFLAAVEEQVLPRLPRPPVGTVIRASLLQLHWGVPAVHYEVWVQRRSERVEVGLHFEGPTEFSRAALAGLLDERPLLLAELGPGWEAEDWTVSWSRVHRTVRAATLDGGAVEECAASLARLAGATLEYVTAVGAPEPAARGDSAGRRRTSSPHRRRRGRLMP